MRKKLYGNIEGVKRKDMRALTVARDGGVRRGREGPFGEVKRGVGEEASDGLVGGARVAEAVEPEHEAARHRVAKGRMIGRRGSAEEQGEEPGGEHGGVKEGGRRRSEVAAQPCQASHLLL